MRREHRMIPGPTMGRNIHCWFYGSWGLPVLVFPSASGMAHEWEANGMVEALADFINGGKVKLYTTESNVSHTLNDKESSLGERLHQMKVFEEYVVNELVPAIREDCQSPHMRIAVTGTSLGAYYAVTFALKYPEIFHYALGMSGRYDLTEFFGHAGNNELYFNNPIAFIPGLEGDELERVRCNTHLSLVCGQGRWEDGNIEETQLLGHLLERKGVSQITDLWGHDVDHAWEWWKRQARFHFGHTFA